MDLVEGQPQLTMTSISSLNDLAPFFSSICQNVTRQMLTKRSRERTESGRSTTAAALDEAAMMDAMDKIIETDFLEGIGAPNLSGN